MSLFKRLIGDWSDLKRGMNMGRGVRSKITGKPLSWVEKRSKAIGEEKSTLALKKTRNRILVAGVVIVGVWLWLSLSLLSLPSWVAGLSSLSVIFILWRGYRQLAQTVKGKVVRKGVK